jgi:Transcriptional regulatory protein, C terminal
MRAVTAHPLLPETPPGTTAGTAPDRIHLDVTGAPGSSVRCTEVRLVGPDAVPAGAVVLGLVVSVPAAATVGAPAGSLARHLAAVTPLADGGAATDPGPTTGSPDRPLVQGSPDVVVDRWRREVHVDGTAVALTRREFDLLDHLLAHPGRVFTRNQLMAALWDLADPRYALPRTVDVHVSRLRRKLGAPHADRLQSLRGVGYRWDAPPAPLRDRP